MLIVTDYLLADWCGTSFYTDKIKDIWYSTTDLLTSHKKKNERKKERKKKRERIDGILFRTSALISTKKVFWFTGISNHVKCQSSWSNTKQLSLKAV